MYFWPGMSNSVADIKIKESQDGADDLGKQNTFYLNIYSLN